MATDYKRQRLSPGGHMSVEAYLQLDQNTPDAKYEYLDGVARLMAGGSVEHDRITYNIRSALEENFLSGPCTVFGSDMQTLVSTKSDGQPDYYYPDVVVSCDVADRRRGNKLIQSPRIVVEVLSPSTEYIDRGRKLKTYQACPTVQEIVLVSQFARHVEVYRRGEDGTTWTYVQYGPDGGIELTSVDVGIIMDGIYKNINFDEPLIEE
jgi:Uma2 family endonuclease